MKLLLEEFVPLPLEVSKLRKDSLMPESSISVKSSRTEYSQNPRFFLDLFKATNVRNEERC